MRRSRWIATIIPLLLFGALLTACGSDDGGSSGSTAQDPAALEGDAWVLTQLLDASGKTQIVDIGVNAQFDGSTISGFAGCNSYNADYTATGDQISFGPIAGTKKICPPDEQGVEDRYLQLLAGATTYAVQGRSMSMNDAQGTPVLQFSRG
jgi:heat shock protein HslJ